MKRDYQATVAELDADIRAALLLDGETHLDGWPAPREIKTELPPAPAFDANVLLPKPLANFVLDEADRMPCAPDYIAAALIVCLGSVIGARCGIKPKRRDDWIVVPNLFGGIVGDPSAKKSPALGTVTRFLDRLEAKEAEKMEDAQKVYAAEMAAYEAHQSAVKASMKKAATGKPDQDKMALAMADMQALEEPEPPHQRRFKSNDSTVEKLGDLLVDNPQGLLVFRDELIGLLASWEKEGREGDKAFYLEGWNGTASFNIDRIARGADERSHRGFDAARRLSASRERHPARTSLKDQHDRRIDSWPPGALPSGWCAPGGPHRDRRRQAHSIHSPTRDRESGHSSASLRNADIRSRTAFHQRSARQSGHALCVPRTRNFRRAECTTATQGPAGLYSLKGKKP